jgi:ribose transport system permease protein
VSAVAVAFVGLVLIFSLLKPSAFATIPNARNMSLDAAVTMLLAVGTTFVIITAGIDLSIGSVLVFAGVIAAKLMIAVGGNGWGVALIGLVGAVVAGAAWGLVNGLLVTRGRLNPIIVTLASMGAALGLAQVVSSGQDIVDVPGVLTDFGNGRTGGIPNLVIVALVVVAVGGFVLAKTKFGRYTYAIGSSQEAARRAGLRVELHLTLVYVLSGTLAGLAGWLSLARFSTTSLAGHALDTFNAITGVLLGGVSLFGGSGSMLGTFFGTLIPVVLQNGLVIVNTQSYWQQVVTAAVLVLAVSLDRVRRERSE